MTMKDYLYYRESYMGYCTECQEWTREMTEPDARDYDCPACGRNTVIGAEEALMDGYLDMED